MRKDPHGIMRWFPRVLGCFLIVGWTMPTTDSRRIHPVLNSQSLIAIGSSLAQYNSSSFLNLPPGEFVKALNNPTFVQQLRTAIPLVKFVFVTKLIGAFAGRTDFVKKIPDALAPYVPPNELSYSYRFSLQDLNLKPWFPEQATMFFDDLIERDTNFNRLSRFVLSGFTCAVASSLSGERFQQLAKAMKQNNVPLREDQLSCLENSLISHGLTKNFEDFPPELLTLSSPLAYTPSGGDCKTYITQTGTNSTDFLKKTPAQRKRLLNFAFVCLKIRDKWISKQNADILGLLICSLDSKYIKTSGKNLLKQLNQCPSFTHDQITAIRGVLSSGKSPFGAPSKWNTETLDSLKGLVTLFDHNIVRQVPKSIFLPWLKKFIRNTHLSREKLVDLMESLHQTYARPRSSGCPAAKTITEKIVKSHLMPVDYTPAELLACLTPTVMQQYLDVLSDQAFTTEQASAVKKKLDEVFPRGYPDSVLDKLGSFLHVMTPADINKWKITTVDRFNTLMVNWLNQNLASAIITKYSDFAQFLNAYSLFVIGTKYICLLNEKQLDYLDERALGFMVSLDPSKCSETTKNLLYPKAKYAFQNYQSSRSDYYNLMKPYLGGAPSNDLKAFSKQDVNMDIDTFMNLRQVSLMKLSTTEVKGLLGVNLRELKSKWNKSPVREWLQAQSQVDLDIIAINISSGFPYELKPPNTTTGSPTSLGSSATKIVSRGHTRCIFHTLLLTLLLNVFPV